MCFMKKISLKNRELRILIYFVLMAIAYYIVLFKIGDVGLSNIDTSAQDPFVWIISSFAKFVEDIIIWFTVILPIELRALVSFVCIVLQITAVFSKKGKRALNYISSIMNLSSSVILLSSILLGFGYRLSSYIPTLCVLIRDIIISIIMICRNNGKRYKNVDLDTAEL